MQRLPIPGAEVRDGEIYVNDVPFDRINRAQQVQFALNLARLRAGELGLVLVDGLECLDAETYPAFEAAAATTGLQFLVNRVTSGPLKVEVTQ